MPAARQPPLKPGRVYRTRELARWSANPTRLAQRLVRDGVLEKLAPGLFVHPKTSRFGAVPPTTEELLRGFLQGGAYVITGPERWNALGLGTTAALAVTLVYNTKRSGRSRSGAAGFSSGAWRSPSVLTPSGSRSTSWSTRRWRARRGGISRPPWRVRCDHGSSVGRRCAARHRTSARAPRESLWSARLRGRRASDGA